MTWDCDNCKIVLPLTPKEIKEKYTNSLGQPLDVFAETVGKLTYSGDATLIGKLQDICWRRFKNRPIGDYDYEVWLDALDDRVNFIWYGHSKTMQLILDPRIADTTTLLETITEDIINDKDSLTTQDLTVTNNLTTANNLTTTNNLTETVDNSQSTDETVLVESEDNPDSEAGATKYLSNRTNTTSENDVIIDSSKVNTGTVANTGTVENTGTVKNTGTIENADDSTTTRTFTRSVEEGLLSERSASVYNAIRKGIELFVNDLEPLFLNRW